jgi:hypothetical protein
MWAKTLPQGSSVIIAWRTAKLFRNYAIGPFHERYEDRRAAELRPPLVQVCLQNRSCTAAGTAGINLNMSFSNFCEGLL